MRIAVQIVADSIPKTSSFLVIEHCFRFFSGSEDMSQNQCSDAILSFVNNFQNIQSNPSISLHGGDLQIVFLIFFQFLP